MRNDEPGDAEIEALVAECLRRSATEGAASLERVAAAHPEHADELRARIARLERLGLVTAGRVNEPGATDAPQDGMEFGDRYRLMGTLGRGGMGVVHLAFDRRLGRQVALKTIEPTFGTDHRSAQRFRREVESHSRLSHPNIVAILNSGEERGLPYFTMEYVSGVTLAERLAKLRSEPVGDTNESAERSGALATRTGASLRSGAQGGYVETACRVARELAGALAYLHENGVVHRDVKPSNVLIADDGRVLLFDLGLAHLMDAEALTRTGDLAGTPAYMAPEQVTGAPSDIDERVDIYALCAVLYELLAMRAPFEVESGAPAARILREVAQGEPPLLRTLEPSVPRELETVVHTGLEKQPGQRYPNASALGADLDRFLAFRPVEARHVGRGRRAVRWARRNPAAALALALATGVAVGTPVVLWRHAADVRTERDRANAAAEEARREATDNRETAEFLGSLVLRLGERSADGSTAALAALEEATLELEARAVVSDATRARLLQAVARVRIGLGGAAEAVPLLDRALALRQRTLGEDSLDTVESVQQLAAAHAELGNTEVAVSLLERAEAALARSDDSDSASGLAVACLQTRGDLARSAGDLERALAHWNEALTRIESVARNEAMAPAVRAELLERTGAVSVELGESSRGVTLLARAAAARQQLWDPRRRPLVDGLRALATAYGEAGRADKAAEALDGALGHLRAERDGVFFVEVLDERLALAAPVPTDLLLARLAVVESKRASGALDELRDRAADGSASRDVLGRGLVAAARAEFARGERERAAELLGEAWALSDAAPAEGAGRAGDPSRNWRTDVRWELARNDLVQGPELEEHLAILDSELPPGDERRPRVARAQARLWLASGRAQEAAERLAFAERLESARTRQRAESGDPERPDAFQVHFQAGVTALQARTWREAESEFAAALSVDPTHPLCAYNAACAVASAGDVDGALEWLERAVNLGLPSREDAHELLTSDPELAAVRADRRFGPLLERVDDDAARARSFSATPEILEPRGRPSAARGESTSARPALIVLHSRGATKRDVVEGLWADVASELGYVLIAPSAQLTFGPSPSDGMRWTMTVADAPARRWMYERPVRNALASAAAAHSVDARKVFIAGVGSSGLLALDLAVEAPELFAGVLLADAVVNAERWRDRAGGLAGTGMRAALVSDLANPLAGIGAETPRDAVQSSFATLLEFGLDPTTGVCEGATEAELVRRYIDALRAIAQRR